MKSHSMKEIVGLKYMEASRKLEMVYFLIRIWNNLHVGSDIFLGHLNV